MIYSIVAVFVCKDVIATLMLAGRQWMMMLPLLSVALLILLLLSPSWQMAINLVVIFVCDFVDTFDA
jgi:hypothetical protein